MYSESYDRPRSTGRGFGGGGSGFGRGRGYQDDRGYNNRSYNNSGFDDRGGRGGRGRGYTNDSYNSGGYDSGRGGRNTGRGRGYWGNSRGGRGRGRGRGSFRDLPEDVEFLTVLKGHKALVTALQLDVNTKQLYTGSQDSSVRVTDCERGECVSAVDMGGQVDSLLLESGYLFVGMHTTSNQGLIKVWNTTTGAEYVLEGHQGAVLSLAAANGALFSGGHDKTLRVWVMDPATGGFGCQAVLTSAQNGHKAPIQSLTSVGSFLFSADWQGTLKVWDMGSGQCTQTILSAHQGIVMAMLQWEGTLITAGLDGLVRVWQPLDTPVPGAVLESAPAYSHPPDEEGPGNRRQEGLSGVLAMCGTTDGQGRPVLVTAHQENCLRLWELPSFADRGTINEQKDVRAVGWAPGGLIIAGSKFGDVRIWRWKQPTMQ